MDIHNIYDLLQHFAGSSLEELELTLGGDSIRMKKSNNETALHKWPKQQEPESSELKQNLKFDEKQTVRELRAPLAGTFYRAPSPEAAEFVKPGQSIKKGDVVGIIEAMKLMNEVAAEEDGVIDEILAKNGELVAYDEVLIRYV